ncbi:hypothetical protein EC973_004055, partial [Apophysomyces ossiformis]
MEGPMVIFRESDMESPTTAELGPLQSRAWHGHGAGDSICAMEELNYNRKLTGLKPRPPPPDRFYWEPEQRIGNHSSNNNNLTKRGSPTSAPMQTQGCPTARKIAYMGAAADCTYVKSYGGIRYAKIQIINDWNAASAVYERTFNISLGLIYLHMSIPECPAQPLTSTTWNQDCSRSYTINNRLSDFSLWRGRKGEDGAALWHLMTKCSTGVKVGIAWLSQLCETQASQQIEDDGSFEWVSGTGVSSITRDEWKVVAHEIGHGFVHARYPISVDPFRILATVSI